MSETSEHDLEALRAEMAALRQTLADLARMAQLGLSVDELRTQAQGRLTALEAQVVALGGVHGDVVTGAKSTTFDQRGQTVDRQFNVAGNVYLGPQPQDAAEALAIYRRVLAQTCGHLPLRGVDVGAGDPTADQRRLGLANVYIDLDTTTPVPLSAEEKPGRNRQRPSLEERETRPLGALEAVVANRRLALLGDPGGGKTTFVNHLAHCLARHALGPDANWLGRLPGWPLDEAETLPVLVILRDFARGLPATLPPRAEPQHLWDFIRTRLRAQNLDFAAAPVCQALEDGRALALLDGLDEVPTVAQRVFVRDAVAAFAARYPGNRYLVTCRVLSYQPPTSGVPDLRLPGLPSFALAPFEEAKIERFISAWYDELARLGVVPNQDAPGLARSLGAAVRRPDLWGLAPNPLLLTVMALVHTHKGRLPEARALLYEETVDILLWRWEQIKTGGGEETPRLRRLLLEAGRSDVDLKRALWCLAYQAHAQVGGKDSERLADIGELKLEKALAALKGGDRNWAQQVVEAMKLRAGLLLERAPEVFTFPHRTFQEYLAGAHLAAQSDLARRAAELAGEGDAWREVILLAVGRLVHLVGDTDKPLALVGELCPARAADDALSWRKAWLAGDVLLEMGVNRVADSALGRDLLARVRGRLAGLVSQGRLAPGERAAAGAALARLGDDRDFDELVTVPAGPFLMGDDRDSDASPQHEVTLPAFKVGKYPVTNAQYLRFVEATGREWSRGEGRSPERANHPAVYVRWHDARAYCAWLTEAWRAAGKITADEVVRLPTEAEWEKAARGADGQRWPWGNAWVEDRCNSRELGLGTTCAVGMFPAGASPYGCLDVAGQVWEWTTSLWGESYSKLAFRYPYDPADGRENLEAGDGVARVLRGGAFNLNENFVRCAVRLYYLPSNRGTHFGFRIVVSPISPPSALRPSALGHSGKGRRDA